MSIGTAIAVLALVQQISSFQGTPQGEQPKSTGGFDWQRLVPGNTGILGDYVHHIFVDENDEPYIPAYTPFWEHGGMTHWDGEHWYPISNVDHAVIASPRFNDIVADASGVLWIGSDHGLLRYDPAIGPSSLQRFDTGNTPLPGNQITDLDFDPTGVLWIASQELGGSAAGGLVRHDPAKAQWQVWTTANGLPWGAQWPGWDWVDHVAVAPDPGGGFTVWFHGAVGMATWKAGQFTWFGSSVPASAPTTPMGFMSNDPVDELGNLWMTTNKGLARRAPNGTFAVTGYPAGLSTEVACVFAFSGGRAALGTYYSDVFIWNGAWSSIGNWTGGGPGSGTHTYALTEDSTGAIWAGGIGGASKRSNGQWQRYRMTNTGMLGYFMNTIDFDAQGNVYMNGNAGPGVGGFTVFDGTDWLCVNDFNYGLGPPWGLPSDDVAALECRANGKVAVAPSGIQGAFDWDGTSFTPLIPQGYDIIDLEEDGAGRLWAARYGGNLFLIAGGQFVSITTSNSPLLPGEVVALFADPAPGYMWVVTPFGAHRTNGVEWLVYPRELMGLTQNSLGYHFTAADRHPDGTLYLGTGLGLYHFDPSTGAYDVFSTANSTLPSDEVDNVEVAPDGAIWCSTFDSTWPYPGGLTRFDGASSETFSQGSSPLPHNQIATLASRKVGGSYELWVGTASEGVVVLRPRPQAKLRK
jgi:sugar lactone lactonase YvrE